MTIYFPFLSNFKVYRINSISDGNCFFHSILSAFVIPYINQKYDDGTPFNRREFVKNFRRAIANTLYNKDESGVMLYDKLANGNLKSLSQDGEFGKKYQLEEYYKWLCSNESVGIESIEITSKYINRNILVLSLNTLDVYKIGLVDDTYNPKVPSVVLLYTQSYDDGHFDLCGVKQNDKLVTHFSPKNEFIKAIIARSRELEK